MRLENSRVSQMQSPIPRAFPRRPQGVFESFEQLDHMTTSELLERLDGSRPKASWRMRSLLGLVIGLSHRANRERV